MLSSVTFPHLRPSSPTSLLLRRTGNRRSNSRRRPERSDRTIPTTREPPPMPKLVPMQRVRIVKWAVGSGSNYIGVQTRVIRTIPLEQIKQYYTGPLKIGAWWLLDLPGFVVANESALEPIVDAKATEFVRKLDRLGDLSEESIRVSLSQGDFILGDDGNPVW